LTQARENLARGLDLDLEATACRKLVDPGCPQEGDPHPVSALDTIHELGPQVGPTVVIDVGYNDSWSLHGAALDKEESTHRRGLGPSRGRQAHVVLRRRSSELGRRSRFRRLPATVRAGGMRRAVRDTSSARDRDGRLPLARKGKPYSITLSARAGAPPVSWSVIGLPRGLHLSSAGQLSSTPRAAGVSVLTFRLRDSWDQEATVELLLRVRGRTQCQAVPD
jgi:hypothetical protein